MSDQSMTFGQAIAYVYAGSARATPALIAECLGVPVHLVEQAIAEGCKSHKAGKTFLAGRYLSDVRAEARKAMHDGIDPAVVSYLNMKLNQWRASLGVEFSQALAAAGTTLHERLDAISERVVRLEETMAHVLPDVSADV
jgi:hypothetical protein